MLLGIKFEASNQSQILKKRKKRRYDIYWDI